MKPNLTFKTESFKVSDCGPVSSVPDLMGSSNVQNKTNFHLGEDEEIYEGYGKRDTAYPYREYNCYNRKLKDKDMKTAILENDYLKAVFLPEMGGRLWILLDKQTGENLLYTNDVIRPSNVAIRNAWVSGGVEWNISMIGHTPFTMDQIFTARLKDDNDNPILRMYEYERVRKVAYQMDFWLEEESRFLNCRMRIFNQTKEVVPMYWWSNMAVPEYEGGRVVVPAEEAYTNRIDDVYKVSIPYVEGVDVTKYKNIPCQVDYFFDIPKESPKYIANINKKGYGLLQMSTSRLQSRKLFSWGNNEASDNWQDFLTEDAGRYVEIQAGLGKTQYGCIPMAPNTAWEWLELYGPVQVAADACNAPYEQAVEEMSSVVRNHFKTIAPEQKLKDTKELAKKKGELLYQGSEYAAFENAVRSYKKEPVLSEHLDFSEISEEYKKLAAFLEDGVFPDYVSGDCPHDFILDETLHCRLAETIDGVNKNNWYAHYQLGLSFFEKEDFESAEKHFSISNSISENPWALHALAVIAVKNENFEQAVSYITLGYSYVKEDLSYLKETWKILLGCRSYDTLVSIYDALPKEAAEESRIRFGYLLARSRTGHAKEVLDCLEREKFVLDDLRECEETLGTVWSESYKRVYGEEGKIPSMYNFAAL